MKNESSEPVPLATVLRSFLQSVIPLTAFIYAIGFVVANSHYITFGVAEYQLIQARYVATGLLYLFFHLGIATMVAMFVFVLRWARWFVWLFIALGLWGFLGTAVYLVTGSVSLAIAIGINVGIIELVGYGIWVLWGGKHRTSVGIWLVSQDYRKWFGSWGIPQQLLIAFVGIGSVLLVCISAMIWGRSFWPEMSSTLGGGRPDEAVFVFDPESLSEGALPFVPMQVDNISEQLPVLFENSDMFVVLVKLDSRSSAAVYLSKSIVHSVVYAPAGFRGRKQDLPTLTPLPTPSVVATSIPTPATTSTPLSSPMPTGSHSPAPTVTP